MSLERNPFADPAPQPRVSRHRMVEGVMGTSGRQILEEVIDTDEEERGADDSPAEPSLEAIFSTEKEDRELMESIRSRESLALFYFFKKRIEIPPFPDFVTPDRVRRWQEQQFQLHFLPAAHMEQDKIFSGWRICPADSFYRDIEEGSLPADAAHLSGKWLLVDGREKPPIANPAVPYTHDALEPAIQEALRRQSGWPSETVDRRSLWVDEVIDPDFLDNCGVILNIPTGPGFSLRLPRPIEYNVLANMHYASWLRGGTSEWVEGRKRFGRESFHLRARSEDADFKQPFQWKEAEMRYDNIGFRLVVEFS